MSLRLLNFRLARSTAGIIMLCFVGLIQVTPIAAADTSVYPDTSSYRSVPSREIYRVVDEDGVWFTSALGLPCSIKDDGSFGCSGKMAGVRAGENEAAWFSGDASPRLYATAHPQFDSGAGQTLLLGLTYIEYRGSRCSATRESSIYCIHADDPNSQLLVTSTNVLRGVLGS
ncbi:Uncharacterised protein [Mycobacteroides abscessus]|nr:Uncharacterised protein [Mycobacteroides abscessus]